MIQYCQKILRTKNRSGGPLQTSGNTAEQQSSKQRDTDHHGSMEQKRKPSSKPTHLQSINLAKGNKDMQWGKESPQQVMGKLDSCMEINGIRTHPHIMHGSELKILKDLNPGSTPYKF